MRDRCDIRNRTPRRRAWRGGALTLLLFLAAAAAAPAQDSMGKAITLRTTPAPLGAVPALDIADGKLQLSLDQAIEIALQRNLDVVIERYQRQRFRLGIRQALGVFDLSVQVDGSHGEQTNPGSDRLAGGQVVTTTNDSLSIAGQQLTALGGVGQFSFNNSRVETNSANATFNPQYSSNLSFRFTQPLLQNFGNLATKRAIYIARRDSAISLQNFEDRASQTIQDVEDAYWGLVDARDQLKVAQQSLDLAQQLHERNKIQVEVGTMAPLELVQSEATVATRQEEIISAQAAVGNAADRLLQLLNLPPGPEWDLDVVPTTEAETEKPAIDREAAIATALANRPEIHSQMLDLERLEIESRFAHNQVRPSLDLALGYRLAGLGGTVLDTIPNPDDPFGPPLIVGRIPGGIGDALKQIRARDFDGWSVGLTLGIPIQNRTAKAQRDIADVSLEQGRAQLDQLKQQVTTEVRSAVRGVETAAQQIESARISVRLQEKNLDAEQKRYENGMSTSFEITRIQDDLTQARSRQVTAITNYRTALAAYYRAIGQLLEQTGIQVDDGIGGGAMH